MPLTRMPCGPSSRAIARVRLTTPALAATNAHCKPQRHQPGDRGDVDDPARSLRAHHAARRLAHLVDAGQIDGQDAVPFVARKLVDGHAVGQRVDAGVVDEDVEPAELGDDLVDDGVDLVGAW